MARPVKSDAEKRGRIVSFRLTGGEHATLLSKADSSGLSPPDFARKAALSRSVQARAAGQSVTLPFGVADELRRIGVNLNQLTRLSHVGEDVRPELRAVLGDLVKILDQVHSALKTRGE